MTSVTKKTWQHLANLTLVVLIAGAWGCDYAGETEAAAPADAPVVRADAATGDGGMVSSAHPLATRAGVEALERGGNAFDAAVAVASVLTVAEPMNSNLFGGYGTLVVYDAERGDVRYLDNNGRFPKATDADVFRAADDLDDVLRTAHAVSTPGNLRGFETLWEEYGALPWADLLEPARTHAAEGIEVSEPMADAIANTWEHFSDYSRSIYGSGGEPLGAGDVIVQSDLAEAFRMTAERGSEALYGGPLGELLVAEMERQGGFLAAEDLAEYEAEWFEPVSIDYRGHTVVTAGAPSNSFASLVALGIMSRYDNAALGSGTTAYLHRFAEATKHAFWARLKYAGGPEVNPPPFDRILSEAYWEEQASALDPDRASRFEPPAPRETTEGEQTTHFVVADRHGNVVSATLTLGHHFGSAVMVEDAGIWLNNSMAYCTFYPAGNPMDALPGNRKHSSKTPSLILRDGIPVAALGTPGGHTIPQTVPQMVINLLDFEMGLQDAIDAPRIAFAEPDRLLVDRDLPADVRRDLAALGHNVQETGGIGLPHALRIEYDAAGDVSRFVGAASSDGVGTATGLRVAPAAAGAGR